MAAKALMLDPVADLYRRLRAARRRTVSSSTRALVTRWWADHGLAEHPVAVGKRVALALLEQRGLEDRLAGIFVLAELLGDQLRASDLADFATLFAQRAWTDASVSGSRAAVVDAFATKVLGALLQRARGRADVAQTLAGWRASESPAQRRAGCVALATLAPQGDTAVPGLAQLIFTVCATLVWSLERSDQTAVGWVLCELSRAEPARVEAFVRRHARFMTRECARHAVEQLPATTQEDLLAHWKRATALRTR
jgi:3-methyladenine DNA glycosylase AlkD